MKSFLKIGLIALAVLSASIAQADDMELLVKVAKENSKWVSFITSDAKEFDVTLRTADDEVIYEERVKTVGNKFQTYDLSALPEGAYSLKMESSSKLVSYEIEIKGGNAVLSQPTIVEIKRPVLVKKSDIITLDLNGSCAGEVELVIYNEHNEKLHDDVYTNRAKVATKFDVSKTMSKELTFVIRSAGQEFSETIKL